MRHLSEGFRRIKKILKSRKAELFVGVGIKILISVVIGSVLLAGTYTLTKDTVFKTADEKINDMFGLEDVSPGPIQDDEPKQVSFSINGVGSFDAAEGMTWAEWILSYGISAGDNGVVWICYEGLGGYCTKSDVGRLCVDIGNGLGCNMLRLNGRMSCTAMSFRRIIILYRDRPKSYRNSKKSSKRRDIAESSVPPHSDTIFRRQMK